MVPTEGKAANGNNVAAIAQIPIRQGGRDDKLSIALTGVPDPSKSHVNIQKKRALK